MNAAQKTAAIQQHTVLVRTGMGIREAVDCIASLFTDADDKKNIRAALNQHINGLLATIEILN